VNHGELTGRGGRNAHNGWRLQSRRVGPDGPDRTITNNLANANTPGFKRTRTTFRQFLDNASAAAAAGDGQTGRKITPEHSVDFTQGLPTHTGRNLDVALDGEGFFVVETPSGPLYTRCGKFRTNAEGQLVDPMGRMVGGDNGPITVPASVSSADVTIARDGQVSAARQPLGKLKIVQFTDPAQLTPVGAGCFQAKADAELKDAEKVSMQQGFYESSNVSVVEEMVGLLTVTRLYEANLKSINAQDDKNKQILQVAMS
jgi:flagellar basal-body rod protein FlgF